MQNILITGAGAGIGRATARLFHARGWSVGLVDRDAASVAGLAEELGPSRVWQRVADVTDYDAVAAAVAAFAEVHDGRLHCLFNSAGVLEIGRFDHIEPAQHERTVAINVLGTMHCCHAAFPFLRGTPGARVVNMSSASALYGVPHFASYSASKSAVRGLTEALNLEWVEHGITVIDIMPPFVNTGMLRSQTNQPPILDRMGDTLSPEQVAAAVWAAQTSRKVHRPVGLRFAVTLWLSQFAPTAVLRSVMALLSR